MNKFKKIIFSLSIIFTIGFLYFFFSSSIFYGVIQFTELKHNDNDYTIIAKSLDNTEDKVFKIAPTDTLSFSIDGKYFQSSIVRIWDELNENQSYHVLYHSYDYRDKFILKRIYLD
ncbi:hypothetical protein [Evansella tamaricis]|uniref:Uncharacterized protein n=1 Tax=Evansella tamaricis TaxID=2069301 RepID=A0ABS6JDG8_9BACI|nr:hypothetical protein [Evansella tamaricis]MBU9711718.1 hypothetical protein [Evansella tamaricis]